MRFDTIRLHFKATPITSVRNKNSASKKTLLHYSTNRLTAESTEFTEVMTLLASLKAVILIPREYLSVGELKGYVKPRQDTDNSNWPVLDWRNSAKMPPVREEIKIRITAPVAKDDESNYVDEHSENFFLCKKTLGLNGNSIDGKALAQLRALYFEWIESGKLAMSMNNYVWTDFVRSVTNNIQKILVNPRIRN